MGETLSELLATAGSTAGETMKRRASESLRGELEEVLQAALEDAIREAIAESRVESTPSGSGGGSESGLLWLGIGVAIGYLLADREGGLSPETYDEASEGLRKLSGEATERIEPYAGDRSEQVERITEDVAGELDDRAAERRAKQRTIPSVGRRGPLAVLALGSIGAAGYLLLAGRKVESDWQDNTDWESSATDVTVGDDSAADPTTEDGHDSTAEDGSDDNDDSAGERIDSDGTAL